MVPYKRDKGRGQRTQFTRLYVTVRAIDGGPRGHIYKPDINIRSILLLPDFSSLPGRMVKRTNRRASTNSVSIIQPAERFCVPQQMNCVSHLYSDGYFGKLRKLHRPWLTEGRYISKPPPTLGNLTRNEDVKKQRY